MKFNKKYLFLISFLFVPAFINNAVMAQNTGMNMDSLDKYREKLLIIPDRDIYITGEKVWLKVFKMDGLTCLPADISKVIYVELLDNQNNPLNQIKIRADMTSGSGVFRLSDTLSSGNYLLRAYTSWMQNFSEDLFAYRTITIINPFKNLRDLVAPASGQISEKSIIYNEFNDSICSKTQKDHIIVKTALDKNKYATRDRVMADISVSGVDGNPLKADFSVAVVKSFLAGSDHNYLTAGSSNQVTNNNGRDYTSHLPELEGELIRGRIFNKTTNEPLKKTDISLSLVGKTARCQFSRTNENGEFIFVVKDLSGLNEIVIQPLVPDIAGSYVELDQPFCDTYNSIRLPEFSIDSSLAEKINNAVISMQVNNIYEQDREKNHDTLPAEMHDFFGESVRTVKMADYIELINIREVVKEILPEVVSFRKDGKPALKVVSNNNYQIFQNPALVLFDGVPVYNIDKLLEVNAKELDRVEIITSRYFYSDYLFEGIISFVSKEGNLSAIESDNSVFRQVFEGCLIHEDLYSPDYSIDAKKLRRIPDFRNTLYWNPDVVTKETGSAEVGFYTSDEETEYSIIIEGMTSQGIRVHSVTPLIVN